jgi:hypothetical protein
MFSKWDVAYEICFSLACDHQTLEISNLQHNIYIHVEIQLKIYVYIYMRSQILSIYIYVCVF